VVANAAILWNDECIHAGDSGCDEDPINRGTATPESRGDRNAGVLSAQFNKILIIRCESSCQASRVNVLVKFAKEDNIIINGFPQEQLSNQLLKE
jgi:hypothetical protein